MTKQLNYHEFYSLVSDLVSGHKTNTLFGRIDGNHSLIIRIQDGKIVYLACGTKRGTSAIPMIRKMNAGSFRIESDMASLQSGDLPTTTDIMASLSPFGTQDDFSAQPSSAHPGIATAPEARVDLLCELLSDYLGPVASIACRDEVQAAGGLNNRTQITRVITNLAREIEDYTEAQAFIANAHKQLGLGLTKK